jgi:hypothetical protein
MENLSYKIKIKENVIVIQRVGGEITFDGLRTPENEKMVRAMSKELPNYTLID